MNKTQKYIVLAIIVLALIGGGIFAWQYFGAPKEAKSPEKVLRDETANWQTYRNEEFGFEIKYPKDWTAYTVASFKQECLDGLYPPFDKDFLFLARNFTSNCSFLGGEGLPPSEAEIYIDYIKSRWSDVENILEPPKERYMIEGESATMYRFSYQQARPNINAARIYFNHKDAGYLIFLKNQNEAGTSYDPIYDQILSTFRFVE